jgi:hypothetical protein
MDSNRPSETLLTQRDLPIWARAVAAGLLLFASWWLFNTEAIRSVVGDSVGALCLGVIAASILQGMHLPFALWPYGPWRKQFSVPWVIATALLVAIMILIARAVRSDLLATQVDVGTGITVVVGAIGLGFAIGFVRQRRFLKWYGIALGLALLPLAFELLAESIGASGVSAGLCVLSSPQDPIAGSPLGNCTVALVPSLVFLTAIGVTSKLVTEEIAFRRLLIGITPGAGLLSVLASTATAFLWYAVLAKSGAAATGIVALGTLGAFSAGCIYVLANSLLVSALFNAVYTAGYWTLALSTSDSASAATSAISHPMWIASSAICVVLAAIIAKRNGFFGNIREAAPPDATRS